MSERVDTDDVLAKFNSLSFFAEDLSGDGKFVRPVTEAYVKAARAAVESLIAEVHELRKQVEGKS